MLHDPVHFVVFLIILAILPLELYLLFLIFVLYTYLKEAYIDVSYNTNIIISANISNDLFSRFLEKAWRKMKLVSHQGAEEFQSNDENAKIKVLTFVLFFEHVDCLVG